MKSQAISPTKTAGKLCSAADASVLEDEDEPPLAADLAARRLFINIPSEHWNDWRWHFRNRIVTVEGLSKYIPLSAKERSQLRLVSVKYPLAVTPYYMSLMNPDDPYDPIRMQALPSPCELSDAYAGTEDPLAEEEHSVVTGLVHRYPDRALMVLTDICPMLCRHCTRKREWRRGGWVRTNEQFEAMLTYIRQHKEVRDVIISGGDPLTLSTARLEEVLAGIRRIPHVEIIRIGTRAPVVLPQRVDDELCGVLSKYGPIWLNTHFNHPREVTPEAARACDLLLRSGVPVNNQAVLLKGVNDNVETQTELCQSLLRIKVRPYYLFQCDNVAGTEHFWTPVETGVEIIRGMRGFTSGLAIPAYVIDLPNGGGKVPAGPDYVLERTPDELIVRNYQGKIIHYSNPDNLMAYKEHFDATREDIISAW
ncbi:MAG: KamA family radical SAM protein [Dehalococcoidia bacterium]|nr:KamA family radical SAM protein [Dehalococcoidia bacterium]